MRINQLVICSYLASLSHDAAVTALADAALSRKRMQSPLMTNNYLCRKRKLTASYGASETCTRCQCWNLAAEPAAIVIGIPKRSKPRNLPFSYRHIRTAVKEKCLRKNIQNLITFMTKWLKNIFNIHIGIIEIFVFICSQFRYWNLGIFVLIRKHG